MDPEAPIEFQEVIVERLKVAATGALSPSVLHDMKVDAIEDVITGRLILRLSSYVQAQRVSEETTEFERPATWREAFKLEHPRLYRLWVWPQKPKPARMTEERRTWTRWATYPDSTMVLPRTTFGSPVYVDMVDRESVR